ncbi:hypothetical protein VIBNISOn1_p0155 [Vibrio nigripulchritudo SOn1]|uniref:Uncharacterized protein n=1 Tax=Vibrio nigripulchritudo SOn1 TaxID=1238450 RepID=A0AAV2W0B5_9VIBR|nr:hypothetical protein VIBNISOn1_p0155 [Vibrio nigripulchritudo SOn1]
MYDTCEKLLSIADWSFEGRENYVNQNRLCIEVILYESLEVFDELRYL